MPTIGVSIAIPSPYAEMLQAKRASFGDPLADSIPTHVTLLPPTGVGDEELAVAVKHLEEVAADKESFRMVLRGTGSFRPISPVVFVQVSGGLADCELLEKAIRRGPLDRTLEFHYHPHVTVAHHVPEEALDRAFGELSDFECEFVVDQFHLYEHGTDGVWRPVRSFALGG
ncbi:2'-5' RNA ligase [Phycicoccus sp. Root563]|uniref:2'-5' RNA ligase family protein n=1 Tax=unclassified Phycicoccus TaxID=2637926 RepID=UPI000702C4AB|nr:MULTISPECIES: 2'-5' RNA ligase family protein [unclassified Phycicoccus]KQU69292.1 2'-5' RNA ligase [Phycicoccus sp. Root101]KQZ90494.1 2'-5' RNA ligase [Phycicoccus sp. Root563]